MSRRVYQRHDIDFDWVDPEAGKTNLELIKKGRAPIGNDGKPIQLHHVLQKENGPIVEVREITHFKYKRILHGLVEKGPSFRNGPALKNQYASCKRQYWMWRAQQYLERKKR